MTKLSVRYEPPDGRCHGLNRAHDIQERVYATTHRFHNLRLDSSRALCDVLIRRLYTLDGFSDDSFFDAERYRAFVAKLQSSCGELILAGPSDSQVIASTEFGGDV